MPPEIPVPSPRLLRALSRALQSRSAVGTLFRPSTTAYRLCQPHSPRFLHASSRCNAATDSKKTAETSSFPEAEHRRRRDGELVPKPLSRPLGLTYPPQPGQHTGRDTRSFTQKREDLASYERHLKNRKQIFQDIFEKNYYRDIGNLGKNYKGKSIVAPTTPFRSSLALYFPNLEGISLATGRYADTTPVLRDRVSIVSIFNTEWANEQASTFTSEKENPALHQLLKTYEPAQNSKVQFAYVNVEENHLKAAMVRFFFYRLRRLFPKEEHSRYFLNRRGIDDEVREALGIWNMKVGYVYLLDGECRVRWAGNGNAREEEKKSLVHCVRRLADEASEAPKTRLKGHEPSLENARKEGYRQVATA